MTKRPFYKQAGFTLIEMIVSLGVFSVVVTTAVGAILVLVSTNVQLQNEQSVMTNLSFALDTMTREMRTGYKYYCEQRPNYLAGGSGNFFEDGNSQEDIIGTSTRNCIERSQRLQGVSFFEGGNSLTKNVVGAQRITYFYDAEAKTIFRRVGSDPAQSIVSSGIVIQNAQFVVIGSPELSDASNAIQPTITIYIEATEKDDPSAKRYYIQTTVTQRTLDL